MILEQHESINQALCQTISQMTETDFSVMKLSEVLFQFFKMAEELPILKQLNVDEVERLVRKLPEEVVAQHFRHDTDTIEQLLALLPVKKTLDQQAISAAFDAIYFATLHQKEIGQTHYDAALRLLIQGVVMQMF